MLPSPPLSPSSALGPILRPLPLPDPDSTISAGSHRSGGSNGRGSAGGWDATVADADAAGRFGFDAALSADARRSCSVSPHAISHGCSVVGICRGGGGGSSKDEAEGGIGGALGEEGRDLSLIHI